MRIEPEHVLEKDRVATDGRIKNTNMRDAFDRKQQHRDRDDRRAEDHHETRRVMRPDKQRHSKPRHTRGPHRVNRDDKIQARQDRRKSIDKDTEPDRHYIRV